MYDGIKTVICFRERVTDLKSTILYVLQGDIKFYLGDMDFPDSVDISCDYELSSQSVILPVI